MTRFLDKVKEIVVDRRLYGIGFFSVSLIPLFLGLGTQFITQILFSKLLPLAFIPYILGYIFLVIVSGIPAKNAFPRKRYRAFHPLGYKTTLTLLFLSAISTYFAYIFSPENILQGLILNNAIFAFAQIAFHFSILNIAVIGQRRSLQKSAQLEDDFFKKARSKWEKELEGFPNLEKMLESLDEGKYIAEFFDHGSFDLIILWSCSIMGNIVNTATDAIISKFPDKQEFFRKKKFDGKGAPYFDFERCPVQLLNLGFSIQTISGGAGEKFNLEILWETRNNIAHRNESPTFFVTIETLKVLVSFTSEMPRLLLSQLDS
jgi:hypothetical protein